MLDSNRLREALTAYKRKFSQGYWDKKQFKWEAVQYFQNNWNMQAVDFFRMLERALGKTDTLLASANSFPRKMILEFAKAAPEAVRAAFVYLFDESRDLADRAEHFKSQVDKMLLEYGKGDKNHYQNEDAISTYLWLRYPDKYYIYKYSEAKSVAKLLISDCVFKKGAAANLRNGISLYDEICRELERDEELKRMLAAHMTKACYPDPKLHTLTVDVVSYISRYYAEQAKEITYLSEITAALQDLGGSGHLNDICQRMKERGNLQSILVNPNWEYAVSETIQSHSSDTRTFREGNSDLFYSVEGLGKGVWGLRNPSSANDDKNASEWFPADYTPGFSVEEWVRLLNTRSVFTDASLTIMKRMKDFGGAATCLQLARKYGGHANYYNNGSSSLAKRIARETGCPVMTRDTENSRWWPILYVGKHVERDVPGVYMWKLRDELDAALNRIDLSGVPLYAHDTQVDTYTRENFLSEVYMSAEDFDTISALLKHKKNVILQGAPGVGKTFAAMRLAYAMMGTQDPARVKTVQFHQNYSYEDFVMGYRPCGEGFQLTDGIFYEFCNKARENAGEDYFFIIDEINRGNMSKIFGELLMLIESDYRGTSATLAYTKQPFSVPKNLYIIGMMNTADRSLAMIDYALRRRFSFFDMFPAFDTKGFADYQAGLGDETFDTLIECIRDLNREIRKDPSLGPGFCIGHSYFCNQTSCSQEWMKAVAYYDVLPMLKEYWFDDSAKVDRWEGRLRGVFA